jgi:hypothetical protein
VETGQWLDYWEAHITHRLSDTDLNVRTLYAVFGT